MPHEIEAFLRREELQGDGDEFHDLVETARARGAEKRFQLGKREFDRIEVGTVRREKAEARADAFNRPLHLRLLVHRQVIEDDDVARAERRHEYLLDVGEKRRIIERPVEDGRRVQAIYPKRRDNGVRLPMAAWRVIAQSQPAGAPTIAAQQIGRDA